MTEFKVFKLSDYKFNTKSNESKNTVSLADAIQCINNKEDQHLHIKIDPNQPCIIFGDIDYTETTHEIRTILEEISDDLNIPLNKFVITHNHKKHYLTCHWSIPSFFTDIKTLKTIFSQNRYKKFIHIDSDKKEHTQCDNSVYKSQPFRLPYQSASGKTIHQIITTVGKAEDFIIHLIPKDSIKLEWTPKEEPKNKTYDENPDVFKGELKTENKLLNLLIHKFKNYDDWLKMCWILKSLNYSYDVFNEYSKYHPEKYDETACIKQWNYTKLSKMTEGILHSMAKLENPIQYAELNIDKQFYKKDVLPDAIDIIEMNREYLIDLDNIKLNKEGCVISEQIQKFNESNIKSLNIKSPYDTGKTQLLKRYIQNFQPKRILWVSYRKTLTQDILMNFKEYDLIDYQTHKYDSDRLIIQLESLHKILPDFIDDEVIEVPKYDLVIIDEVESVLQQFNSSTMNKHSKTTFELLTQVIKTSNKLITLDGDMDLRTYKFINEFGSSINIKNTVKKSKKEFKLTFSVNFYQNQIIEDLKQKKKLVIASQTASDCDELKAMIEKYDDKLKIGIYTGITSDLDKKDLNNVIENWQQLDVIIYSPTIESGVNFDVLHFDKLFCVVCAGCNSQRGFLQMISRARKLRDNDVLVYCKNLKYYDIHVNSFYSFNEINQSLTALKIIEKSISYENGKITKSLKPYDINYIYNKKEELMKDSPIFYLNYLKQLIENKGHSVVLYDDKTKEKNKHKIDKVECMLSIKDICDNEFEYLMSKQRQSIATTKDKLKIKKHFLKKSFGVDILDESILEVYHTPTVITNFENLIDIKNIKSSDSNKYKEDILKTNIINDVIDKLGFKIFDDETTCYKDEFEVKIKNLIDDNELFKNTKLRTLFTTLNYKTIKNNRDFMKFVNEVLSNYGLIIKTDRRRTKKCEGKLNAIEQVYKLSFADGYESINEIIQYKINKGYKLNDTNNIRPDVKTSIYKHLIKDDVEYDEFVMDEECDEEINPLDVL